MPTATTLLSRHGIPRRLMSGSRWRPRACLLLTLLATSPAAAEQVDLYGVFEFSRTNPNSYANKFDFNEIALTARFTRPDGSSVSQIGFHDGDGAGAQEGQVWRLRFMPDRTGDWTYSCSWTGSGPRPPCQGGSFTVVASGRRGPLRVSESNPRYFEFANGDPFFPRCYYLSELFATDQDVLWRINGVEKYFGGEHRFNCVVTTMWQASLIRESGWSAWTGIYQPGGVSLVPNGHFPLLGCSEPYACDGGDFHGRPNISRLARMDEKLLALHDRGVVWADFDGFYSNTAAGLQLRPQVEQDNLLKYIVARFSAFAPLIWQACFECDEIMSEAKIHSVVDQIADLDPFDHPVGAHDDTTLPDYSGFTLTVVQDTLGEISSSKRLYDRVVTDFAGRNKPVYCLECAWEGVGDGKNDGDGIRTGAWGVLMAGGMYLYAEQFDRDLSPGFQNLYGDGEGFPYLEIAFDFFESLPYQEMNPEPGLVSESANAIVLTDLDRHYVVQVQTGGSFVLDLSACSGARDAEWLDPRSGTRSPASPAQVSCGGSQRWTAPDSRDWVLHVFDKGPACSPEAGDTCQSPPEVQTRRQQKCIAALSRQASRLESAQGRVSVACARSLAAGKLARLGVPPQIQTGEACPTNDVRKQVARRLEKLLATETSRCLDTPESRPDYAYVPGATAGAFARAEALAILGDLFGPDLDAALVTVQGDSGGALCQRQLVAQSHRLIDRLWTVGISAMRQSLRGIDGPPADSRDQLQGALLAELESDPRARVASRSQRLQDRVISACGDPRIRTPLSVLLPGRCDPVTSTADLATCAVDIARCRFCRAMNSVHLFQLDCDRFDDGRSDGTCS